MRLDADNIGFLGADDVRRFEELLAELVVEGRVSASFLIDRAGRLLAAAGDMQDLDHTSFASLASADFAASNQLAALLGEDEFSSIYHHGGERSMFLADIAGTAVLAVLFDSRTTLGMVRLKTRVLLPQLAESLTRLAQSGPSGDVVQMEAGWAAEAESEIERLFDD
jgi:predicted regulator of Ras-like GTPase activity (Roadblock/LC7/MglB family)